MQLIWEYGDILSVLDEDNLVFVPASYLARCETTPSSTWAESMTFGTKRDGMRGASDAPRLAVLFAGKEHPVLCVPSVFQGRRVPI